MVDIVTLAERLAGAVWGHLIGDALGVPYEFRPPDGIGVVRRGEQGTHHQPSGTWSDDGGLMLALLDSLLETGFDLPDQGRRALRWLLEADYKPGPLFDVGNATHAALSRIKAGVPAADAGGRAESDNGNGSLMRILPVALTGMQLSGGELFARACQASAVTHAHPRSRLTCALYCLTVRGILQGESDRDAVLAAAWASTEPFASDDLAGEVTILRNYQQRDGSGYVVDTFWSAWDAFRLSDGYAETVERAIRYGNDTDTTACVAGGLAGAYWGVASIPPDWFEGMRGREMVGPLVEKLLQAAAE